MSEPVYTRTEAEYWEQRQTADLYKRELHRISKLFSDSCDTFSNVVYRKSLKIELEKLKEAQK